MNQTLTIGRLARTAGVGVETIRYYQERALLPVPPNTGSFRQYPISLVDRIQFIKRAQGLGFLLDEIADLLALHDGANREKIRAITAERLAQIETKISSLNRMRHALCDLLTICEQTGHEHPCPIIETLADSHL